jgi:hypothetical protein
VQAGFALIFRAVQDLTSTSTPNRPPLSFVCGGCGLTLSVPLERAGSSGPCPACGAWLTSPAGHVVVMPGDSQKSRRAPATGNQARTRTHRKGRIRADSMIDHTQIDQRETVKSLVMLACFVMAICACLAVTWYLKDWLTR